MFCLLVMSIIGKEGLGWGEKEFSRFNLGLITLFEFH